MIWFLAGAASWSAAEYAIHRFVGHGKNRSPPKSRLSGFGLAYDFNREHLADHTNPSYFAPTSHKVLAASVAIPAVTAVLTPLLGLRRAASFAIIGSITTRRRARTRASLGVTSPVWDLIFRTEKEESRSRSHRSR